MESLTKNRQSFGTIRTLAVRAYGEDLAPVSPEAIEELGHGWFNVAYKITLTNGEQKVLKIAPPTHVEVLTHERGAMLTELAAIELIKTHTTVPVPNVDYQDTSCTILDVPYFFMDFISAEDPGVLGDQLTAAQISDYTYEVGRLNKELNSIVGPGFGPLLGPHTDTWTEAYYGFFNATLADGERRNVDLGYSYTDMRDLFAQFTPYLDDVTTPRYIEQDMWVKAVLFRDGKPVAHIDHERAIYGDPLLEAGFACIDFPAFGDAPAFMRGYGLPALNPSERARRTLYSLHLALIMVIESEYRGFDQPEHLDFVRKGLTEKVQAARDAVAPNSSDESH